MATALPIAETIISHEITVTNHRLPSWVLVHHGAAKNLRIVKSNTVRNHEREVSSWIEDGNQFGYLGGDAAAFEAREQAVRRWTSEGYGGFLLLADVSGNTERIGFINVQQPVPGNETQLEIGRLVIAPQWRRQGFGRLLVDHIAEALATISVDGAGMVVNARTSSENWIATRLFKGSLLLRAQPPSWATEGTQYIWWVLQTATKCKFGPALASFRRLRGITQEALARSADITRPTLSQFENPNHPAFPSHSTLLKLIHALRLNQKERASLMLALIGDDASNLQFTEPLDSELDRGARHRFDLWVLSSEVAEASDERILSETETALREGFQRYYFVPPGRWDDIRMRVIVPLIKKLTVNQSSGTNEILEHLRLYEAPSALCAMRVAIKDARTPRLGDPTAQEVSVCAPNGMRALLDDQAGNELVREVARIVKTIERVPAQQVEGFRLRIIASHALVD